MYDFTYDIRNLVCYSGVNMNAAKHVLSTKNNDTIGAVTHNKVSGIACGKFSLSTPPLGFF